LATAHAASRGTTTLAAASATTSTCKDFFRQTQHGQQRARTKYQK
jgi:hypothetical protein